MNLTELLEFYCKQRNCKPSDLKSKKGTDRERMLRVGFVALAASQGFKPRHIMNFLLRKRAVFYNAINRHKALVDSNDSMYKQLVLNPF